MWDDGKPVELYDGFDEAWGELVPTQRSELRRVPTVPYRMNEALCHFACGIGVGWSLFDRP